MKNIHLLPTDKLSRLLKTIPKGNLLLAKENTVGSDCENQHLYITSDEEIKEGDWGFVDGFDIFKCLKPFIANETTEGKNIPCFYIQYDNKSNNADLSPARNCATPNASCASASVTRFKPPFAMPRWIAATACGN